MRVMREGGREGEGESRTSSGERETKKKDRGRHEVLEWRWRCNRGRVWLP